MLPPDPDPAWSAELARRSAAVDAGLVKCVPGDEVMARLRKKVGLNG
jgi:putative addiction module component (TIGR02574 family)